LVDRSTSAFAGPKGEDSLAQSHGLDEPGRQPVPVEIVGNSRSTVEIACLQHRKINIVWRCAEVHHHAAWIENATRFRKDVDLRAARYQYQRQLARRPLLSFTESVEEHAVL